MVNCTTNNVLFRWKSTRNLSVGAIELIKELSRDIRWGECLVAGPTSEVKKGDDVLLSARPVSAFFELDGEIVGNTSDNSCLAYKRDGKLYATGKTILYSWIEEPEEITDSGIVLVRKTTSKEQETRWALVHAAGPETGVQPSDHILIMYKADAYKMEGILEGVTLHNAGYEEVICYKRPLKAKIGDTAVMENGRAFIVRGKDSFEDFKTGEIFTELPMAGLVVFV